MTVGNGKLKVRGRRALGPLMMTSVVLAVALSVCATTTDGVAQTRDGGEGEKGLSLALPQSGEMVVENRRGAVDVEVWDEAHVELFVRAEGSGARSARGRQPVSVARTERLLTVETARAAGAAQASRVDLRVRVPRSARLKVFTSAGELSVRGLPASLLAQTVSGDLSLSLPDAPDARLKAQSLNGAVSLDANFESVGAPARVVRGVFRAELGAASRAVNLFSGRGRVFLRKGSELGSGGNSKVERGGEHAPAMRRERVREEADDAAPVRASAPRTPPLPSPTPEEVDEDEVVRVETDLVTLNVSVVDRASGRGIEGLAASDFELYEDDVLQRIEHFESAEAPFDLLLLLDLSGSTARVTEIIRSAAWRFVAATRPQDRIAVITFAGDARVVSPLTSDRRALRAAIERISAPQGGTRLYDSLASALDFMARDAQPARRRAVVLMSDGLDSTLPNVEGDGSAIPFEELRSRAQEFDGVLYTIWTSTEYEAFSPDDVQPETFDLAHDRMAELAEAGGGVFFMVERMEDLAGAYERVVADLGTVYSLSYRPSNRARDGSWRRIRIRLPRRAEAVARGRRGYNAN